MTRDEHVRREPRNEASKPRDTKSQGIVRDQRGQEQPADKERAQRATKTDRAG
jgi:hypothetical protein